MDKRKPSKPDTTEQSPRMMDEGEALFYDLGLDVEAKPRIEVSLKKPPTLGKRRRKRL